MNQSEQAGRILRAIDDPKNKDAAEESRTDPILELRGTLLQFLTNRAEIVTEVEELRRAVRQQMAERLNDTNVPLTFEQLERLHAQLGSDARQNAEQLVSIFESSPGNPSPLADLFKEKSPQELDNLRILETLTPEKQKILNDAFLIMQETARVQQEKLRTQLEAPDTQEKSE
jgi:hypothetical protein